MTKVVIINERTVKDGKLLKKYNTANTMEDSKIVKDGIGHANGSQS